MAKAQEKLATAKKVAADAAEACANLHGADAKMGPNPTNMPGTASGQPSAPDLEQFSEQVAEDDLTSSGLSREQVKAAAKLFTEQAAKAAPIPPASKGSPTRQGIKRTLDKVPHDESPELEGHLRELVANQQPSDVEHAAFVNDDASLSLLRKFLRHTRSLGEREI